MKTCPKCETAKPWADFREKPYRGRYYRSTWCRACDVEYARAWRDRHPGYHAGKSRGYRALAVSLIPLVLLAGCLTPGEHLSEIDEDRLARVAITAEAAAMKLRPSIKANAEAIDDLREDNAEVFGRALERVSHEGEEARQSMQADTARHEALAATQRDTARRDALSRDRALQLALDRHVARNDGARMSMMADVKIVRVVATTAGVMSSANSGRLSSVEKRIAAEDSQDEMDKSSLIALLAQHRVAVAGVIDAKETARTTKDDARAAKIEAGVWDTVRKLGGLGLLLAGAVAFLWRLKGKRG